ncbi:LptA/OstA family protein [Acetobacter conturbans]|uniref:Organic solvent tolerance-like N-terminal domain-containing protein n=1 Tax=Acetobacter conturbans TaxID=1737472 RepID=A0ABX0K2A1_9PROT|nr:LptA/OstA family protein [Acetobacter conturbans]NHN88941.1 hypothetical protein [Acetobacter conturbans]
MIAAIGCWSALSSGTAHAQAIDLSHGGQITVTAVGGFDWDQNAQKVTAYDQAQAVRGDVTVTADKLIAYYRKKAASPDAAAGSGPAPGGKPSADQPPTVQAPTSNAPPPPPSVPAPATPPADAPKPADGTPAAGGPDASGSNEIYRLEAIGHVHIFTQTDQGWGDKAVYDIDQATLVMNGHAMKLTTPQDVLTARDSMEYYSQTRISIGRGNATVTTNEGKQIKADVLVGYSAPPANTPPKPGADPAKKQGGDPLTNGSGKLEKVNAFGHVWVRTQTETITGDRGVYVPDTGIARIVGNVHITRGQNQLEGAAAVINMHTGVATMTERPGERVSGLVVPNSSGGH